jgi:hypothetical protein
VLLNLKKMTLSGQRRPSHSGDSLFMCNDYEQHIAWAEYCKLMLAMELGISTDQSGLDLPRADDIRINDTGPVMRAAGNGIELVPMNFSFRPAGPRGGPVFNFRSDTAERFG